LDLYQIEQLVKEMRKDDLFNLLERCDEVAETAGAGDPIAGDLPFTKWDDIRKCHDWRNYVDPVIRDCWENMNIDGMMAVYIICEQLADKEEWE
jgi:hypothetical protein